MPAALPPPRDIAVIDIGSNSVRLVLYRQEGRALWTTFNEKVLAGLGRDLGRTGKLHEDGAALALTALRRFAAVIEGVRPDQTLIAATAAVREAADGEDFRQRVAAETGLRIRVLSGEEEARYAALGVLAGAPRAEGVSGDMGGSSLELTRLEGGSAGRGVTLPLGPFAMKDSGKAFDPERRRDAIRKVLAPAADRFQSDVFYAVGGAWRTLGQVHMAFRDYPLKVVHQYEIGAADALATARLIARQSKAALEKLPGVSRKRMETLPHAALMLEAIVELLGVKRVELSAWGVREGLIYEGLDDEARAADPLVAGCAALGARQGIDTALPGALEGWVAPLADALPGAFGRERDRLLTAAACRLADLGARLHPDHRVELTFDQVLRAPIPGQSHAERAFLAAVVNARYGGPVATPEPEAIERLLGEDAARRARGLGLAIRLACDLSGRSSQLLANASAAVDDGALRLTASPGYADVLLGEQTRKRAKALAEAMGLGLAI